MFYLLSKVLDLFLSPYTWGLVLLSAAVPWRRPRKGARRWKRRRMLGALGLAVLLVASAAPVQNALAYWVEHSQAATVRPDVTYDVVILLGGIVNEQVTQESGQPSYNDNVERVVMTERLLRDGRARNVIISGGTGDPRFLHFAEAVQLGRQLEAWGIARDRIIIEDKAKNTRENALFASRIVRERGFGNVLVVTSAFHMARAADCFRAVGLDVDLMPVDYRATSSIHGLSPWLPRAGSLADTSAMLREALGRVVYRTNGYGRAP